MGLVPLFDRESNIAALHAIREHMKEAVSITAIRALRDNYVWLLHRPGTQAAAVVDPGEAGPVERALEARGLALTAILVTHHHRDHVGGIAELVRRYGARVYGPASESIPERSVAVADDDEVVISEIDAAFTALHVPGHTLGAITYVSRDHAFTGDTLFMAGCGRLFEGTAAQMHASLTRIAALPARTRVYCGHEYTLANLRFAASVEPDNAAIAARIRETAALYQDKVPAVPATIDTERETNPFLRCTHAAVRAAAETYAGQKLEDATEVFAALRKWKDRFA